MAHFGIKDMNMIRYFMMLIEFCCYMGGLFERDVAEVRANCLKFNKKFLFSQVAIMFKVVSSVQLCFF